MDTAGDCDGSLASESSLVESSGKQSESVHPLSRYGEGVKKVGPYFLTKTLGQGAFSKVKLGIHDQTEAQVAIKVMKKDMLLKEGLVDQVKREISFKCSLTLFSSSFSSLTCPEHLYHEVS